MNQHMPDIQPETRTLKELAASRLTPGQHYYHGTRFRTLLLLKPDGGEWPSALLRDRVLQPVDKVVLLLAITLARQTDGAAYLPRQKELATMANVASPDTVWRAVSILRCARWLVSCQRISCKGRPAEPCAYVVCSRPLPLPDTLFLDPDYAAFLDKSVSHGHQRVRAVADLIRSQLPDDIRSAGTEQHTLP
ncbi:MAG: hypothetical protein WD672_04450 [Woeseia sp.]